MLAGIPPFLRRHWVFMALFAAGLLLRAVTMAAYRPALLNAAEYLALSEHLQPGRVHPAGYPLFLRILPLEQGLAFVSASQHLLGLGLAVLLYALLLRLGVRAWLAALAAAPALLDSYQLSIEQYVTPEVLFELLLVGGCAAILWRSPAPAVLVGASGLLFALATLTRTIGLLAFVPAVLTLLFLRIGLTRVLALVACFVVPLAGYAAWYHSVQGQFGITGSTGRFLYGRVVSFVDCSRFTVSDYERALCPQQPVRERPPVNELLWGGPRFSPLGRIVLPPGMNKNDVASDFAERAIVHQPGAYARAVGADLLRAFAPTRKLAPGEFGEPPWQFHEGFPIFLRGSVCSPEALRQVRAELTILGGRVAEARSASCERRKEKITRTLRSYGDTTATASGLIAFLRAYQRAGYAPGPALAACLFLGFAAALGLGRACRSGLRSAAFLFSGVASAVCLGSVLVTVFSWRYQVPQLVLLPAAGALGITALAGLREGPREESEPASTSTEGG
jgi:hypothetical protein